MSLPSPRRGLAAAIACIAVFGVSHGMSYPLFAVRLEAAGWSAAMTGLSGAVVALAALTLAQLMPPVIARLGLPVFLAGAAALSAVSLAAFALTENYWVWLALRFVQGAAATALFLGSEAWIVAGAPAASRGRIVGLYATVLSLGFAAGPPLATTVGLFGAAPFLACAAVSLLCAAPLALAWRDAPRSGEEPGPAISSWRFFRTDPTVIGAVVLFGMIEFGVMALLPVWGARHGMDYAAAALLVSALVLGSVALQIPLGALAERADRRRLLMLCAATCLLAAGLLPLLAQTRWPLWVALFVWGGLAAGLYTIALIELGARYEGRTLVAANAAVVSAYGLGALAGPLLVGAAMDLIPPDGLSVALALCASAYLALAAARGRTRVDRLRRGGGAAG